MHLKYSAASEPAHPAHDVGQPGMGNAQQRIHLRAGLFVPTGGKVNHDVIHRPDFSCRLTAEAPYRSSQRKGPDRRADGYMLVFRPIDADRLNGHIPAMHGEAPAPPEPERAIRSFSGFDFIQLRTRSGWYRSRDKPFRPSKMPPACETPTPHSPWRPAQAQRKNRQRT